MGIEFEKHRKNKDDYPGKRLDKAKHYPVDGEVRDKAKKPVAPPTDKPAISEAAQGQSLSDLIVPERSPQETVNAASVGAEPPKSSAALASDTPLECGLHGSKLLEAAGHVRELEAKVARVIACMLAGTGAFIGAGIICYGIGTGTGRWIMPGLLLGGSTLVWGSCMVFAVGAIRRWAKEIESVWASFSDSLVAERSRETVNAASVGAEPPKSTGAPASDTPSVPQAISGGTTAASGCSPDASRSLASREAPLTEVPTGKAEIEPWLLEEMRIKPRCYISQGAATATGAFAFFMAVTNVANVQIAGSFAAIFCLAVKDFTVGSSVLGDIKKMSEPDDGRRTMENSKSLPLYDLLRTGLSIGGVHASGLAWSFAGVMATLLTFDRSTSFLPFAALAAGCAVVGIQHCFRIQDSTECLVKRPDGLWQRFAVVQNKVGYALTSLGAVLGLVSQVAEQSATIVKQQGLQDNLLKDVAQLHYPALFAAVVITLAGAVYSLVDSQLGRRLGGAKTTQDNPDDE